VEAQSNYIKTLQILFKALLLGPLLFIAIVIVLFATGALIPGITGATANIFLYVVIVVAVLATTMSYKLFSQKLEEAKQQNDLTNKLDGYRAAFILQLALCEGPALFSVICYFLTENKMLLVVLLFLVLNFARLYPTKTKIVQQLELDDNEESMFD
jgi:cobalamin biosynthesis protein CobD/CbiB